MQQIQNMDRDLDAKAEQINSRVNMIANSDKQLSELKDLIKQTNDPELKSKLQDQYEELRLNIMQRISLSEEVEKLEKQTKTTAIPVPPSINDYVLLDGSIDTDTYNKAIQEYEKARAEYGYEIAKINAEMRIIEKQITELTEQAKSLANVNLKY